MRQCLTSIRKVDNEQVQEGFESWEESREETKEKIEGTWEKVKDKKTDQQAIISLSYTLSRSRLNKQLQKSIPVLIWGL